MSEKILDKIKKLLELANSGNENEANLAAQRAAELMAKHAIDEAQVRGYDPSKIVIVMGRVDNEEDQPPLRALNSWISMLIRSIAQNANGQVIQRNIVDGSGHRVGVKFVMVGTQEAIDTTRYLFMWLSKQLLRECRTHLANIGGRGPEGNAFLQGAVFGIHAAMLGAANRTLAGDPGTAMVLISKQKEAAKQFVAEMSDIKKIKQRDNLTPLSNPSFGDGYEKGKSISINRSSPGLTSGSPKLGDGK